MKIEEELAKLSSSRSVLVGLGIALFYWFTMFESGDKLEKQIEIIKQSIEQKKAEIKSIQNAIIAVKEFSGKVAVLGDKFEKIVKYIPEDFTTVDQMRIVSRQAKSAGASIESISQGTEGTKLNFYQELNVNVNLKGTYTQIVLFLSFLTKLDKVLVMKEMDMSAVPSTEPGEPVKINFKGRITGYRYIDEKKEAKKK